MPSGISLKPSIVRRYAAIAARYACSRKYDMFAFGKLEMRAALAQIENHLQRVPLEPLFYSEIMMSEQHARCRRTRADNEGRTEYESVKSGDMCGGFYSLQDRRPKMPAF